MTVRLKAGVVADVPRGQLIPDPNQPRKTFDQDSLKRLAETMTHLGVKVPLSVRMDGKKIVIVDGERRWRAAKIGNIKTLPCLLDSNAEHALETAATQITTSQEREGLTPIDIAEFLAGLQEREKMSMNQLQAALAERGIKEIGRVKIQKYLAMTKLPEWAKNQLRDGTLKETHGAALVAAVELPQDDQDQIEAMVADTLQWNGSVTAKEISDEISGLRQRRARAEQDAKTIAQQAIIGTPEPGPGAETDPSKVTPRKLKHNAHGIVNVATFERSSYEELAGAKFDTVICEDCPHHHSASYHKGAAVGDPMCFFPVHFHAMQKLGHREQGRKEQLREYLETITRAKAVELLPPVMPQQDVDGLITWLATGALEHLEAGGLFKQSREVAAANHTMKFLHENAVRNLPSLLTFVDTHYAQRITLGRELAKAAIRTMNREQLRWYVQNMGLLIDGEMWSYRIDAQYLALKRKGEMAVLAKKTPADSVANMSVTRLREYLLEQDNVTAIGVPDDLKALFYEAFPPEPHWVTEERFEGLQDDEASALDESVGGEA